MLQRVSTSGYNYHLALVSNHLVISLPDFMTILQSYGASYILNDEVCDVLYFFLFNKSQEKTIK